MFNQMNTQDWLALPPEVKNSLIQQFKIKRSGITHVVGNQVQTDGYTAGDLSVLSIQNLQEFTGLSTQNFPELFTETLVKLNPERYGKKESTEDTGNKTIEEQGSNEGKSEESVIPAPVEDGLHSGGSEEPSTSNGSGIETSVQQPAPKAKRGRPRVSKTTGPKE